MITEYRVFALLERVFGRMFPALRGTRSDWHGAVAYLQAPQ